MSVAEKSCYRTRFSYYDEFAYAEREHEFSNVRLVGEKLIAKQAFLPF
jgi:hypothetical protein